MADRATKSHLEDVSKTIEQTILPEGYNGKILLVKITGGAIDGMICLRSGDSWHREILRNTEIEIKNLGFTDSSVYELGGAHVRFNPNGDIVIFGTSDDFGACDKYYAQKIIKDIFKDRNILVTD